MDPNVGFNSPAMDTTSKSGLSSARILRRKKPTPSTRYRQQWMAKDNGFNPFRKAPETSMGPGPGPSPGPFGLSGDTFGTGGSGRSGGTVSGFNLEGFIDTNAVSDELNKLSIESNRAKPSKNISETEKFMFLETRDAMKQLNIDEGVDFRAVLKRELEKLNMGDDTKVFSETAITDHLNSLKIEETMASNCSAGENERADANSKETREAKSSKVEKGSARNEGSLNSFSSGITTQEGLEGDRCADQAASTSTVSFISDVNHLPGIRNAFGRPLQDEEEENTRASFSSTMEYKGMENLGFGALNLDEGLNGIQEQKKETAKVSRYRKRKGKVRKHIPAQSHPAKDSVFKEKPQANDEFVEPYSPMDVSPYRDMLTDEVLSQQATVVSDQKLMHDGRDFSMESQLEASSDVREEDYDMRRTKEAEPFYFYCEDLDAQGSSDESVSDAETGSFKSATDHFGYSSDSFATAASDTETTYSSIAGGYDDGVGEFNSCSSWAENGDSEFHVGPSAAGQSQTLEKPSSQSKKKDRVNITDDFSKYTPVDKVPFIPSSPLKSFPVSGSVISTKLPFRKGTKSDASYPLVQCKMKPEEIASSAARNAARELCEKWRLRGNQAYANRNMSEAEKFYTEGVNAISESESCRSSFRALMLCYSNRAATRLSIGRINEALEDCLKAISIDPNFPRVHIRAANCYLALGEIENAYLHFERGSKSEPGISVDEKLLAEASEGLQKAKKAREIFKLSSELLHRRKPDDAERALLLIDEALMLSPYSEELLIRKADALLMMQKYEDVIQFCRPSLITSKSESSGSDNQQRGSMPVAHRILFFAKAYFYLGRLEDALDLLKNRELLVSEKCGSVMIETVTSLAGTISELLRLKDAGNRSFQSGKHDEAVQHYTAAISWNVLSRPFTAICFCNRAAAYQALGQVTDALADCSLAIALDPNYSKPYSRRAALFEKIGDYRQAAVDLQRLVSLLTIKLEDASPYRTTNVNELKQTNLKLSLTEEAARKEVVLNIYLILGVDHSATASEIKKAYRRAALKFHPDKAGQSLARSEGADDIIWKEITSEVYTDADKLFKMIGEAYAILSDSSKRAQYDLEEEMRNIDANRERGNSIYGNQENYKSYPYGRGRWEEGRPYGNFYRWASHGSGSYRRYYS